MVHPTTTLWVFRGRTGLRSTRLDSGKEHINNNWLGFHGSGPGKEQPVHLTCRNITTLTLQQPFLFHKKIDRLNHLGMQWRLVCSFLLFLRLTANSAPKKGFDSEPPQKRLEPLTSLLQDRGVPLSHHIAEATHGPPCDSREPCLGCGIWFLERAAVSVCIFQ